MVFSNFITINSPSHFYPTKIGFSVLRNFSRAGVAKNRSATSISVPRERAAGRGGVAADAGPAGEFPGARSPELPGRPPQRHRAEGEVLHVHLRAGRVPRGPAPLRRVASAQPRSARDLALELANCGGENAGLTHQPLGAAVGSATAYVSALGKTPIVVKDCRAEFGPPPGNSNWTWRADHPSGMTLRLADGKWHTILGVRVQDYREVTGTFDHVVSVGMFEHVGPLNRSGPPVDSFLSLEDMERQHIVKALEKNRELRYQSAADIRADLKRLVDECYRLLGPADTADLVDDEEGGAAVGGAVGACRDDRPAAHPAHRAGAMRHGIRGGA
mgnify:CR=1 FL=1